MATVQLTEDEFQEFMLGVETFYNAPRGKCLLCPPSAPPLVLEAHHIFPQCCGGTHLPEVDLCGNHHTLVHGLAREALASAKHGTDIQFRLPADANVVDLTLLRQLVQIIVVAEHNPLRRRRKLPSFEIEETDWKKLHHAVARLKKPNSEVTGINGVVLLALRRLFDDMGL